MDRESIQKAINYLEGQPLFEDARESYFFLVGKNKGNSEIVDGLKVEKYDSTYGDGDGSYQEAIYKITNAATKEYCFIRFHGERSSWGDDHWYNEFQFVEPKQVIKTTWDKCEFNLKAENENEQRKNGGF